MSGADLLKTFLTCTASLFGGVPKTTAALSSTESLKESLTCCTSSTPHRTGWEDLGSSN